jgi:hypothetical protein
MPAHLQSIKYTSCANSGCELPPTHQHRAACCCRLHINTALHAVAAYTSTPRCMLLLLLEHLLL